MPRLHRGLLFRACLELTAPSLVQRPMFGREVAILMYHAVVDEPLPLADWCFLASVRFRRQMEYLKTHFDVISMSAAVRLLRNGGVVRPTAVITFDDGFQNVFDIAFPVLQRLGLPATVFLNTGFVDRDDTVWFCHLIQALAITEQAHLSWCDATFDLRDGSGRLDASSSLQARLKVLPQNELLEQVEAICAALRVSPAELSHPASWCRMLNSHAIQAMLSSGLVEFGAHTVDHAILTRLSPDQARQQIEESVRATATLTGQPCQLFAYPNGRARDYSGEVIDMLRNAGVKAAVTTRAGGNTPATPLLELRRYPIGGFVGPVERLGARLSRATTHTSKERG